MRPGFQRTAAIETFRGSTPIVLNQADETKLATIEASVLALVKSCHLFDTMINAPTADVVLSTDGARPLTIGDRPRN